MGFPHITAEKQRAYEASKTAETGFVPEICGYRGRACRQLGKAEGANRMLCMGCALKEACK